MKKKHLLALTPLLLLITMPSCHDNGNGKIQLSIGFWPEDTDKRDVAMYTQWKQAFEADNPEYEIIAEPYTYDTQTIGSKFLTDTLPDVFQTWFTEPAKLVNKKYIRSITNLLTDNGWLDKMEDEMRATLTFDNQIYGIPRDGYGLGLLINIETLGDCGLLPEDDKGNYILYNEDGTPAYPTTFQQIYDFSEQICSTTETKGLLICSANKNGGWQFSNIAWNYGAKLQEKDENGKWIAKLNSQECIDALTFIQDMKKADYLLKNVSVVYDDWYGAIEDKVAMAIVGNDVLHLANTNGKVDMKKLAYVPMPTGNNKDHYSLYGGTPYVFSAKTTDEQVKGILKFFEYIGRTPDVSEISKAAMELGNKTATEKGQPILPTIKPWKNQEYVEYATSLENEYITVDMDYYKDFFEQIGANKHAEEPNYPQEMYEFLDNAIISVFRDCDTANPRALLTSANAKLQDLFDKNLNK